VKAPNLLAKCRLLACVDSVQLEQPKHSAERQDNNKHARYPSTEPRPAADTARPEHTHIRRRTPTHRQLPAARGANPRLLLRFSPPPSKRQGCFSCSASIHVACHDPEHCTAPAPALDRPCKPFPSAEPAQPERLSAERGAARPRCHLHHTHTHTRSPPRRRRPRSITPPLQGLLGDNHRPACASDAASQPHNPHLIPPPAHLEHTHSSPQRLRHVHKRLPAYPTLAPSQPASHGCEDEASRLHAPGA
jgi:hypothetical protein